MKSEFQQHNREKGRGLLTQNIRSVVVLLNGGSDFFLAADQWQILQNKPHHFTIKNAIKCEIDGFMSCCSLFISDLALSSDNWDNIWLK